MKSLISITGPSGSGKTSIAKEIMKQIRSASMVPSYTTREPRHNDLPGEYRYISTPEFQAMVDRGMFLWTAEHGGNRYGTSADSIENVFASQGSLGIMILVPAVIPLLQKFLKDRELEHLYVPFFIEPPPQDELEFRLIIRGDSEDDISLRLKQSRSWHQEAVVSEIEYTFVSNDDIVETAANEVLRLIR